MLKTGSGCREEDNETVEGIVWLWCWQLALLLKGQKAATVKKGAKKDHAESVDYSYGLATGRASFLSSV
jgi:hypothetical protein